MSELLKLKPALVWKYFYEITQIPRPSKKEEKIIAYLENFAKTKNLEYKKDKIGNILIIKEATPGFENRKTVVLQSHMDMVCEKNSDKSFDFEKDAIEAHIEGEWVKANGTTLGGDDGIGMAAELAILDSTNLQHGKIECLFTVDEETGLSGAFALTPDFVQSRILINLDSEDWGEVFIGCAGGRDTKAFFNYKKDEYSVGADAFRINVKGLKGGHSGDEIHKGLGNSIKILTRLLLQLENQFGIRISQIDGGNLRNAIPREAFADILIAVGEVKEMKNYMVDFNKMIKNEFAVNAPELKVYLEEIVQPVYVIDKDTQTRLLLALLACPHGEMSWSATLKNLVETSTNLASVKTKEVIEVGTSQRSSVESALNNMVDTVQSVFKLAKANKVESSEGYPGWEPRIDSPILEITKKSFKKLFNEEPNVRAIHAGLECGIIGKKYPGIDMVSFGPTVKGAHSPDERMNIKDVEMFWDLLLDILKNIPE